MSTIFQQPVPGNRDLLIASLKRFAKQGKKTHPARPLAWFQDQIAVALGYSNWSMLHKHVAKMSSIQLEAFRARVYGHSRIGPFLNAKKVAAIDQEAATEEMREFVFRTYSRLIDFALFDSEAENGFAWPEVDLSDGLQDEFGDKYPIELIVRVANDLEISDGPWGLEDYGRDEDEDDPAATSN